MIVKRWLRSAVFALLRFSGLPFLLRELWQRNKVTIAVYHALPADRAAAHFAALRSRYHVIGLSDFLAARSNRTTDRLPPRALIITFDDGHKSNYDLRPLLEAHRIPVTIFLCGGIVGTQRHYWWLHARNAANAQRLKALPDEQRTRELLNEGHTDTREYNTRHALSRVEIEEMKGMVDFQSHTMFHPILPACSDERAEQEIVESKQVLESQFGLRICALAYPNGDFSDREILLLQKAGYTCGLKLDSGVNDCETDLFQLRRVPLPDDAGINEVIVKTSGLWSLLTTIRSATRRRLRLGPATPAAHRGLPTAAREGGSA